MRSMHLYGHRRAGPENRVVSSCTIERRNGEHIVSSDLLEYELPELPALPSEDDAEPFLIAAILDAMKEGRSLFAHGSVSKTLLSNLSEFRDAWHCWFPGIYSAIEFDASTVADASRQSNGAEKGVVSAFSGGVDSTFSVWRHINRRAGHRSQKIECCAFARGLDIFDEEEFQRAFKRAQETLATVGLPLHPIRTNLRSVIKARWTDVHGAALASCLHHFKGVCSAGLIASSWDYELFVPYGSNPVTDPLLSSRSFQLLYDGASFARIEKVLILKKWKAGKDNLRVCWAGEKKDENCGRCEKCIRTRMEFQVNGLQVPESLYGPVGASEVRRMYVLTDDLDRFYCKLLGLARKNEIGESWVHALHYVILRSRMLRFLSRPRPIRRIARIVYRALLESGRIARQ